MSEWPQDFPENCPPESAAPTTGTVYRFVDELSIEDFTSYFEQNPSQNWGEKECMARGLSVFRSKGVSVAMAQVIPALRKKKLAEAKLETNAGVIANTPTQKSQYHYTYWPMISKEELVMAFTII